ncbi:MAG: serine/threonine protein kinase, partial [candidate division Zixibacteria bacterium]|nr:serine/threonine protein kinase [candidate division Zixibacteria bacterium]
ASFLLDSALLRGEAVATTDKIKTKLPRVDVGKRRQVSLEPVPMREIRASRHDQENQPTAMIDASQHQPFDHQALNLGRETDETAATPSVPETPIEKTAALKPGTTDSPPPTVAPEEEIAPKTSAAFEDALATPQPTAANGTGGLAQTSEIKSLGRYKVSGVLGKGAMGMVYRGVDPAINRPVALKTIRLDFVNDPEELAELKERLYREAQAAGKLSHPNIVTIYDVGSEGHLQYIAMECLEGQTLEEMIKKKVKFNYRIIAQIIMQICSALQYAHEQGIVHRDIKPANIMILKDYRAKVMDYGIARVDSSSMTKTGIAMGTPNYISPEQLKGQKSDHRADLFSLGVVMYELLLGKRPFKGENITSLMYSVLNHEPEKPSNINPQIPLLFDRIIDRALKKDNAERYQKASEIMADLSDFVEAFSTRD